MRVKLMATFKPNWLSLGLGLGFGLRLTNINDLSTNVNINQHICISKEVIMLGERVIPLATILSLVDEGIPENRIIFKKK
jgi:hypothetical protein